MEADGEDSPNFAWEGLVAIWRSRVLASGL